ncbi:hypothetical protein BsWGS_08830 [Bradybaena similaris]
MMARFNHSAGTTVSDETSCKLPCQHPSCWASQRRQENGVPHKLPPIISHRNTLSDETDLPMQSILNLLSEYGKGSSDCCPESLGEGCSHHDNTRLLGPKHPGLSASTGRQHRIVKSIERNPSCKPTNEQVCNAHLHLVEIEDPIENRNFSSGWNELTGANQLYVWLPNAKKVPTNFKGSLEEKIPHHPLMKNVTECMIPEEVGRKRQSGILFADWPTLKKKHACGRRPAKLPAREKTALSLDTLFSSISNPHSGYTLDGQLNAYLSGKPYSRQSSEASGQLNAGSAELLREHKENTCGHDLLKKPTDNIRGRHFIDDSLLPNRLSRQRSRNAFLGGYSRRELTMSSHQTSDSHSKVTPILLELPEFSAHVQRPKPFFYGRQDFDFSLGPAPVSLPRYRSRFEEDDSDQVPRVGSGTSATVLVQQTCSNTHADEFFHDPGSPPAEMQATFHEAGSLRTSSTPELQPAHPPHNHMVPDLGTGTRSDLQWTTARRHAEPEHVAVREKSILDDNKVTAESPAPPPPSPEPRV